MAQPRLLHLSNRFERNCEYTTWSSSSFLSASSSCRVNFRFFGLSKFCVKFAPTEMERIAISTDRARSGSEADATWTHVVFGKEIANRSGHGSSLSSLGSMLVMMAGIGIMIVTWYGGQRWRWLHVSRPAARRQLVVIPVSTIAASFWSFLTRAAGLCFGLCGRLPRVLWILFPSAYCRPQTTSAREEVMVGADTASVGVSRPSDDLHEDSNISPGDERPHNAVTESELKLYMQKLESMDDPEEPRWEKIIDKAEESVSYVCYQRDPKDGGPTQYYSTTVFEDCSPTLLRDFYMDSTFRLEWDEMLVSFKRLGLCEEMGAEIGHFVKKFPLFCSPRDYVLIWRLWNAPNDVFYYIGKSCDHAAAPEQRKPVRVTSYDSAWRIRRAHSRTGGGASASEIVVLHREDMGLQRNMAKMGARKGTWTYVKRMNTALRLYAQREHLSMTCEPNAVTLAHPVPRQFLEDLSETSEQSQRVVSEISLRRSVSNSSVSSEVPVDGAAANSSRASRLPRLPSIRFRSRRSVSLNRQQSSGRTDVSSQERQKRRKRVVLFLAAAGVVLANGAVPGLGTKIAATCLLQSAHLKLTRKWRAPIPDDVLRHVEDPL